VKAHECFARLAALMGAGDSGLDAEWLRDAASILEAATAGQEMSADDAALAFQALVDAEEGDPFNTLAVRMLVEEMGADPSKGKRFAVTVAWALVGTSFAALAEAYEAEERDRYRRIARAWLREASLIA